MGWQQVTGDPANLRYPHWFSEQDARDAYLTSKLGSKWITQDCKVVTEPIRVAGGDEWYRLAVYYVVDYDNNAWECSDRVLLKVERTAE